MAATAAHSEHVAAQEPVGPGPSEPALPVRVEALSRRFGGTPALAAVSLSVGPGEIHALVGPNGAGKTTLLRVLTGLLEPDDGCARVLGLDPCRSPREMRRRVGVVTSEARSFYLRISGFENLVFFGRLYGLRHRAARTRAQAALEGVGLEGAARKPVSAYSKGMQRRLAMARATLHDPSLLLIDEATHDLDPDASANVRELVAGLARGGAAVLWTTQRLEEIKGFAGTVTLLDRGVVRFAGTVPQLLSRAERRSYVLALDSSATGVPHLLQRDGIAIGRLSGTGDDTHYLLTLADGAVLGDAFDAIAGAGLRIVGCSEARPSVEEAFLSIIRGEQP